jgi:hypothetical protein
MRNETLKWTEYSLPSAGKVTQHLLSVMNLGQLNDWQLSSWLTPLQTELQFDMQGIYYKIKLDTLSKQSVQRKTYMDGAIKERSH